MKIQYETTTEYGTVTRQSHNEYTHIVFLKVWPKTDKVLRTVIKKLGRTKNKMVVYAPDKTQPVEVDLKRASYCGSLQLAMAAGRQMVSNAEWNGNEAEAVVMPVGRK